LGKSVLMTSIREEGRFAAGEGEGGGKTANLLRALKKTGSGTQEKRGKGKTETTKERKRKGGGKSGGRKKRKVRSLQHTN